jgi:cell division protein ZipA
MVIKLILLVVLIAILTWTVYKLVMLNRQDKSKPRAHHREPTFNKTVEPVIADEGLYIKDEIIEDSDSILGLNPKKIGSVTEAVQMSQSVDNGPVANKAEPSAAKANSKPVLVHTIAIHMMAPKTRPYIGYELLQALLAAGLRYGEKQIFHRHEHKSGKGEILFHLASVNAPGTFELAKMGGFSCPGLSFFMVFNNKVDNVLAFETLLDTANQLVEELGGELWDENYKPITMDKLTEYRIRVRNYNESIKVPDFFDQPQEI